MLNFRKDFIMAAPILRRAPLPAQAALDAIIKAKAEGVLARPQPLLDNAEVFAGLKALHQQRAKRAA